MSIPFQIGTIYIIYVNGICKTPLPLSSDLSVLLVTYTNYAKRPFSKYDSVVILSLCSGSACNLRDDEDDYDEEYMTSSQQQPGGRTSRSPGKQNLSVAQMVENNITAIKMKKLRAQMVNNQQAAATGASTSKSNTVNNPIFYLIFTASKSACCVP